MEAAIKKRRQEKAMPKKGAFKRPFLKHPLFKES
jgi:hypothetical protein